MAFNLFIPDYSNFFFSKDRASGGHHINSLIRPVDAPHLVLCY
jgi:hypothetical protein